MANELKVFLSLDVGSRRIGVAVANNISRLPKPLTTLIVDHDINDHIKRLIKEQNASALVAGLPRNLEGHETHQTTLTKQFIDELRKTLDIPIYLTDEAVTSIRAEETLKASGSVYEKGDIDALSAAYILEDYLNNEG